MKMALKWIRTDIAHGRVKPTLNNENKLVELYLKKLRGTVAKSILVKMLGTMPVGILVYKDM